MAPAAAAVAAASWHAHPRERPCRLDFTSCSRSTAVRYASLCHASCRCAAPKTSPNRSRTSSTTCAGGEPKCHSVPVPAAGVSKRLPPTRPLEASGWLGSFRYCVRKRVRSSRRHCFTVGACGPYASPVTSATAVPRTPSARTSSAIETLKLRASTAMCVVSCSAAGWAGRIVANSHTGDGGRTQCEGSSHDSITSCLCAHEPAALSSVAGTAWCLKNSR